MENDQTPHEHDIRSVNTEPERYFVIVQAALRYLMNDDDRWNEFLEYVKTSQIEHGAPPESAAELVNLDRFSAESWISYVMDLTHLSITIDTSIRLSMTPVVTLPDTDHANPFDALAAFLERSATSVETDEVDTETNGPVE